MNYYFLEPAKDELDQATAYYESQRAGLREAFKLEINKAIQRILDHPAAWIALSKSTRCCRTNRFPYGVVYNIRGEDIFIVAIMHLHRKPGYWKNRL
jgi:hypothetical protein